MLDRIGLRLGLFGGFKCGHSINQRAAINEKKEGAQKDGEAFARSLARGRDRSQPRADESVAPRSIDWNEFERSTFKLSHWLL